MNTIRWHLDLDNLHEDSQKNSENNTIDTSTVESAISFRPGYTHSSIFDSLCSGGDIYNLMLRALHTQPSQFAHQKKYFENLNRVCLNISSINYKPASLIVFRYTGDVFPAITPEIIKHSTTHPVRFNQSVSRGDSNFTFITDNQIGSSFLLIDFSISISLRM